MNETQVLERLTSAYASVAAPAPSAELAACIDRGGVGDTDDDGTPDAVVVPLAVARPRTRVRYLVAAAVATVAAFSGLAVAGALPDPVQRQVSSMVSHFGIHLPSPDGADDTPSAPEGQDRPPATSPVTLPVTTTPDVPPAAGIPGASSPTDAGSLPDTLGDVGGVVGGVVGDPTTSTTLPPTDSDALPELEPPDLTVPPLTVPEATLPPVTVPELPLPQLPSLPLLGL